jgi:hypothetical protein
MWRGMFSFTASMIAFQPGPSAGPPISSVRTKDSGLHVETEPVHVGVLVGRAVELAGLPLPRVLAVGTFQDPRIKEGADMIVRLATIGSDRPTRTFFDRAGNLPW